MYFFIAFLEVEEILIFLRIAKMMDELFINSFSQFRQRHYFHRIKLFFYHISTTKRELSPLLLHFFIWFYYLPEFISVFQLINFIYFFSLWRDIYSAHDYFFHVWCWLFLSLLFYVWQIKPLVKWEIMGSIYWWVKPKTLKWCLMFLQLALLFWIKIIVLADSESV